MVAEPGRSEIPIWDSSPATLETYEESVLIYLHSFAPDKRVTVGPKLLSQFQEGSPQRALGLKLLRDGDLQKEDGALTLLKVIKDTLGAELEQDVSEQYQRYLHRGARRYCQPMQSYIAEEAYLHDRALKAVGTVEKRCFDSTRRLAARISVARASFHHSF